MEDTNLWKEKELEITRDMTNALQAIKEYLKAFERWDKTKSFEEYLNDNHFDKLSKRIDGVDLAFKAKTIQPKPLGTNVELHIWELAVLVKDAKAILSSNYVSVWHDRSLNINYISNDWLNKTIIVPIYLATGGKNVIWEEWTKERPTLSRYPESFTVFAK